jgi:tRNA threonylcarbamoyladenosine biosynthesis protein TsaE
MEMEYELSEIDNIAAALVNQFASHPVWAFYAPMGAGKTTLISAICRKLGYSGNVTSPTFALMNEYMAGNKVIVHMDWYRIENEQDAFRAGLATAMDEADHCFIEWPEKAPQLIDDAVLQFEIEKIDETKRRISLR